MPIGNQLAEAWIRRVRWLKGRRPNGDEVISVMLQITRLAVIKPAVDLLVSRVHDEHHGDAGQELAEASLQKARAT